MRTLFMRVALLVLITVPLLVAQAGERKFEKKFTVKSGEWLTVATDLGSVRVVGGKWQRGFRAGGAERAAEGRRQF